MTTREIRSTDNLRSLIVPLDIRRDNPKTRAQVIMNFLDTHGASQLEELSHRELFALHVKTLVNDARVDVHSEEIMRKYRDDFSSREREDATFMHLKSVKGILDLYEKIEKFSSIGNTALDLWIRMNSALTLSFYLERTEMSALEYMGLEEAETIFEKQDAQYRLIEDYSNRIAEFGESGEIAQTWLDRFNRKVYERMCLPYMLDTKAITSPEQFEEYQRPHLSAMLKNVLLQIASERRE
ncbi:MAG: hypothetical protein KGH71_01450 [Candidatus Micrarchaeota archaeon]|nr:hypothetical protein [Candidatus Micrarchaeota archaeon]